MLYSDSSYIEQQMSLKHVMHGGMRLEVKYDHIIVQCVVTLLLGIQRQPVYGKMDESG